MIYRETRTTPPIVVSMVVVSGRQLEKSDLDSGGGGCAYPSFKSLTPFQTRKYEFLYPI